VVEKFLAPEIYLSDLVGKIRELIKLFFANMAER